MIDYIFFDAGLCGQFIEKARKLGVAAIESHDEMGINVALPEDLPDDVGEALEAFYDELLEQQAALVEANEPTLRHAAGIHIDLCDGSPCLIRIEPALMNRLLSVLSIEELHQLVTGIAHAVENPVSAPICHAPGK
ncbi:MAG: hypothetical protein KGZ83_18020 [Sulfuricella sp.]|nr:hypothetical protein [Sulfuricella sp.]